MKEATMEQKTPRALRYEKLAESVAKALRRRNFAVDIVKGKEEALTYLLSHIAKENTIAFGGSQTLAELGAIAALKDAGFSVLDRDAAKTPAERTDLMRRALLCDTFLMSTNALSEDGQLVNMDGNGNRLAALLYGPKEVFVICGMNKVVKTLDDAISRCRNIAAPENAQRFGLSTPCSVTGLCQNCTSPDCICAQMVVTRMSKPAGRIHVLLIRDDLGM
jgi:L-lactate utilization protein LutB